MANPVARLIIQITSDTSKATAGLAAVEGKLATASAKMQSIGKSMTKGITLPLVAIGGGAIVAAMKMDDAMDTIRAGTGATGAKLQGLGADFKEVMGKSTQSTGDLSKAFADLQTRTELTGKPLQDLATQMGELGRITDEDLGEIVRQSTRTFGDWSIATDKQSAALDYLFRVSQSTGIGVTTLEEKLVRFGVPLRQLGFDFETSAALLGKFEKEGVNTDQIFASLNRAAVKLAKDGIPDMGAAWQEMQGRIKGATSDTEALTIATEYFGSKAAANMAGAIRENRFEVDGFVASLKSSDETIGKAAEDTLSLSDKMKILKNKVILAAEPLGKTLVAAIERMLPAFEKVLGFVAKIFTSFSKLPQGVQTGIIAFAGIAAAAGPLLSIGGKVVGIFSKMGGAIRGIGGIVSKALGFFGGMSKSMNSLGGIAGGITTPLLSSGKAAGDLGTQAAKATGGLGSMMGVALPVAGAVAGIGIATWQCIAADRKAEKARRDGIIAASDMTSSYEDLRAKTQSLTAGTEEYKAAMAAQAAKAQEIVDKAAMVGAVFDEMGNVIDVDTQFINLMADGYRKGTKAQVDFAEATSRGKQTLQQGIKVHAEYGKSAKEAKSELDAFKKLMYEKMRAGEEMSANDQIILSSLTQSWQSALKGQAGALDGMEKAVVAFGKKISGPEGLSSVTQKDLGQMITAMANASPQVREKGLAMFQQIINAEAAKNPAIQANMQTIMDNVKAKIDALPAGERTAAKMQEIINEEMAKYGPITDEMKTIMTGVDGVVKDTDLKSSAGTIMETLRGGIVASAESVYNAARDIAANLQRIFGSAPRPSWVPGSGGEYHKGGLVSRFHSGGLAANEVPAILEEEEYVHQESAVRKYGLPFMNAVNSGTYQGGGVSVHVEFNSVSPEYDVARTEKLLNGMARRAAHSSRMMPRTV